MNCNTNLRTAIAAVLGTVSVSGLAYANDVPPTLADAASSSAVSLYVAGSSAAKKAVLGALETNLCGGVANALVVSSVGNTNFGAVSCTPASGVAGADGNTYYTVYYRFEGGSVTGALPLVNNDLVETLDLIPDQLHHLHLRRLQRDGQRLQLRQWHDGHLHRCREREERATGHHGRRAERSRHGQQLPDGVFHHCLGSAKPGRTVHPAGCRLVGRGVRHLRERLDHRERHESQQRNADVHHDQESHQLDQGHRHDGQSGCHRVHAHRDRES